MLIATVAFFPLVFLLALAMPERPEVPLTYGLAITVVGTLWIGLAIAHAILLRQLPHGGGLVLAVLLGTFIGDTAAYLGGRMFGARPLALRVSPNKTVEGLACGVIGAALAVWWYGLSSEWMGGVKGILLGLAVASRRRSATCSSPRSSATRGRRTRARCSAPTAARWTGWTPHSSPW